MSADVINQLTDKLKATEQKLEAARATTDECMQQMDAAQEALSTLCQLNLDKEAADETLLQMQNQLAQQEAVIADIQVEKLATLTQLSDLQVTLQNTDDKYQELNAKFAHQVVFSKGVFWVDALDFSN